jgi:hypothetical protein
MLRAFGESSCVYWILEPRFSLNDHVIRTKYDVRDLHCGNAYHIVGGS